MKKLLVIFLPFFLAASLSAQTGNFRQAPLAFKNQNYLAAQILQLDNSTFLFFYLDYSRNLFSIKSTDGGNSWKEPSLLLQLSEDLMNNYNLSAFRTVAGRIFLTYRGGYTYYAYSDNGGESWNFSSNYYFRIGTSSITHRSQSMGSFFQAAGQPLVYIFSFQNTRLSYLTSVNSDSFWSPYVNIPTSLTNKKIFEPSLVIQPGGKWICSFRAWDAVSQSYSIHSVSSSDNGVTWSAPVEWLNGKILFHRLVTNSSGELTLIYNIFSDSTAYGMSSLVNYDICYRTSVNDGGAWSSENKVTRYKGMDSEFNVDPYNNKINISFLSERGSTLEGSLLGDGWRHYKGFAQAYYGTVGVSTDETPPPVLVRDRIVGDLIVKSPWVLQCQIIGDSSTVVTAEFYQNTGKGFKLALYDDGNHSDSLAGDGIFGGVNGGIVNPINQGTVIMGYTLSVSNSSGAIVNSSASQIFLANYTPVNAGLFNSNNLYIPFSNDGIIADLNTGTGAGGKYDNSVFLFSSGFFLSGLAGTNDWANGVLSASRIQDYSTGPVREYPGFNSIFIVKASDAPFSKSWQDWRYAVADGASFYDGNGDAIYNPVDLNNNSVWDTNEDRPDLIGDFTAWCVFNDGIPSGLRRFSNVDPMGIEIQQTIFGWSAPGTPLSNSMFVRYSLINKSGSYEKFDSVYFSFASDPDLGDYADDLVGSDSLLNLGYVYNSGPDVVFGNNCPAFGIAVLQGPPAYIPGKTFTDVNGNGVYDQGSDTPLDTAFNHKGKYLSRDAFPGAENLKMTSFQHYMSSHPTNGDPNTKTELRNYLLGGRDKFGQRINPCTWSFGSVYPPANCALVNPEYFYSGDPVTSTGWLNNTGVDQRMLVNTGPFTLVRNKKVEIIGAYSVGRHSTASLNSVNVLKDNITYLKDFYNDNFTRTGLPGANSNIEGEGFSLGDNYPNPFNPVTVIGFSIPVASEVSLKVYDILGNEVADLVNSAKTAGYHNVQFNSTGLSSGVYFYQLRAGQFSQIKKMIIVK